VTKTDTLEKLTVRDCKKMGDFLHELAISFAYHPAPSLKEFGIVNISNEDLMADRVEPILKLVPGVQHLYLSTSNSEVLDVTSAIRSGAPPQTFLMVPLNNWRATDPELVDANLYQYDDFVSLIETCSDLQKLGLYLVPLLSTQWDYIQYTIRMVITRKSK
jgi:hypothetical protein